MSKRETADQAGQSDLFGPVARSGQKPRARRPPPAPAARPPLTREALGAQNDADGLLNVRQAAVRLGMSKSTLDKMRCAGKGPRFIKTTDRAVRYDPVDLAAWIEARRKQSTGD